MTDYFESLAHEIDALDKEIDIMERVNKDINDRYYHFADGHHSFCIRFNEVCEEEPWERPLDNLTCCYLEAKTKEKRKQRRDLYATYFKALKEKIKNKEEPYYSIAEQYWIKNNSEEEDNEEDRNS